MAVRRRPSYGFDLAGTSLGVRPEAGVSRSTLAQLFPELNLKADAITTGGAEEIEKPDEPQTKTPSLREDVAELIRDEKVPGSEFQKYNLKGSLSYAAPFNVQVGPTGPQGRGSRLGYSGVVEKTPAAPKPKSLAEMSAQDIFKGFSQYDQGEQGLFGGQDVDYLRGQGVGDETIREVARLSSGTQQTPAAVYARLGGTLQSPQSAPTAQVNPQAYATNFYGSSRDVGQQGLFGGQDVDAMRSQGYTDEQIRATASAIRKGGQALPAAVFRRLGDF